MKLVIFDYIDLQLFLTDYYKFQKKSDSRFSYQNWSEKLGLNNKTLLRMIVTGQRKITTKTLHIFRDNLQLTELEKQYFDILVDYSQAKNQQQKQALGVRLIELHRQNFQPAAIPADSVILNDVYGPIVLTIISSSQKALKIEDLENYLPVKKSYLEPILESLLTAGLIKAEGDGYTATHNTFQIPQSFGHKNLRKFYEYWIQHSLKAIDLPAEIRRFRSVQVALSQEEFDETVDKFNDFILNLLSRFENNTIEGRHLYLMNTALFPLTVQPQPISSDDNKPKVKSTELF